MRMMMMCGLMVLILGNLSGGAESSGKIWFDYDIDDEYHLESGEEGEIEIGVTINNEKADYDFEVWGYIYRGSKSYSGERDGNKIEVEVDEGDEEEVGLVVPFSGESGMYKIKVLVKRDDRKTSDDYTQDIEIIVEEEVVEEKVEDEKEVEEDEEDKSDDNKGKEVGKDGQSAQECPPIINRTVQLVNKHPVKYCRNREDTVVYKEKKVEIIEYTLMLSFGLLAIFLVFKKL